MAEAGDWIVEADGDVDRERAVEQGNVVDAVEIVDAVGAGAGGGVGDLLAERSVGKQAEGDVEVTGFVAHRAIQSKIGAASTVIFFPAGYFKNRAFSAFATRAQDQRLAARNAVSDLIIRALSVENHGNRP